MPAIDINRWMLSLLAQLEQTRQRQLVSLQGPRDWCDGHLQSLSTLLPERLLLSERAIGTRDIPLRKAETWLGNDARLVIVDLFDGLNPDLLCVAAGMVQSSGVLLLLSPFPHDWDLERDRYARWQDQCHSRRADFVDYFFGAVEAGDSGVLSLTPESALAPLPSFEQLSPTRIEQGCTAEQEAALRVIEQWHLRGEKGIALLAADRGRGKSTCLALLYDRLGGNRGVRILLSANSRQAAARALQLAPGLEFVAPDRLLQLRPAADLVVIDEAATIPLSMLRQISDCYPRVVMATTTGGYEGTGHGFMLRFVAGLAPRQLLRVTLSAPVRWCAGDHLESWINRVMMLEPAEAAAEPAAPSMSVIEYRLLQDPGASAQRALTRQVHALLSSAHYRTRPSDLRMLMENPALRVIVATAGEQLVGATLLNLEGGFDSELCEQVYLGRRRPRGHLLAQMLTAQAGCKGFAGFRGLRILRIAVAADYRRRGIGSRMLEQALGFAHDHDHAYLGASFALDAETIAFWQHNRFALAHVSFAAGKSSGQHSIAVLRALDARLEPLLGQLQRRIRRQLHVWLTQFLQTLDSEQVTALLRYSEYRCQFEPEQLAEVEAFATGHRGFELCFASLQPFVMHAVAQSRTPAEPLLIEKGIQNRDWELLSRGAGSDGRRQLQQRLRRLVEPLLKDC